MINYKNINGNSDISKYDIGENFIIVEFNKPAKDGLSKYKYTYASAGQANVEQMKVLARQGFGLNAFIDMHVRKNYEKKW